MATGILFRLPIPVQPMKAIAAAAIAEGMTPPQIAAAGIILAVNVTLGFLAGVLLWAIFRRWNNSSGRKGEING